MKRAHFGHGTADAGTPGVHMGHGRTYDVLHRVLFGGRRRRVFTRLAALSGVRPGDRVLDVGCGTGYFTRVLAEAVTSGGTVMGVDPSREVIARARRLTRVANCTFSGGIAEALDAPDGSYDVVVSSLMIHHLSETLRPQAIREMLRVLRPGGRVLVADFRPPTSRIGRHLTGLITAPPCGTTPSICSTRWFVRPASSRCAAAMSTRGSGTCRVPSHTAPHERGTGRRRRWHLGVDGDRSSAGRRLGPPSALRAMEPGVLA